jgi:hypothetical protein
MRIYRQAQDCLDLIGYRGYDTELIVNAALYCFARQIQTDQNDYLKVMKKLMSECTADKEIELEVKDTKIDTDIKPKRKRGRPCSENAPAIDPQPAEDALFKDLGLELDP